MACFLLNNNNLQKDLNHAFFFQAQQTQPLQHTGKVSPPAPSAPAPAPAPASSPAPASAPRAARQLSEPARRAGAQPRRKQTCLYIPGIDAFPKLQPTLPRCWSLPAIGKFVPVDTATCTNVVVEKYGPHVGHIYVIHNCC